MNAEKTTWCAIGGKNFPVQGILYATFHPIPLLNIRMMSDERERELSRKEATA